MSSFKRAEKKDLWLKMFLTGPSGSGKTFTALRLASGLGKKIAVIDTEYGSAAHYADMFEFDHLILPGNTQAVEPHRVTPYIQEAGREGYEVLVIDSSSHIWYAELDMASHLADKFGGNSAAAWSIIRPREKQLFDQIMSCSMHCIVTAREEEKIKLERNEDGKVVPVRLGLQPRQVKDVQYNFDIWARLDRNHNLIIEKARDARGSFSREVWHLPGDDFIKEIQKWLKG